MMAGGAVVIATNAMPAAACCTPQLGNYDAACFIAGALCMVAALLNLRVGMDRTPSSRRPALVTAES